MTTRFIRRTIALSCVPVLTLAAVAPAGVNPQPFRTGLFGLAARQSVRVSLLNASDEGGACPPAGLKCTPR